MLVTRREVCQDGCFVPVVDQLLPTSIRRIGNVGWLIWAWEWRIIEDEGLGPPLNMLTEVLQDFTACKNSLLQTLKIKVAALVT